jgi:enolase
MSAENLAEIDRRIIETDGTKDKSKLGANATLAVSLAAAKAAAASAGQPLYRYLGGSLHRALPTPMMNILNGGAHAANGIDVQEFMILPVGLPTYREGIRACAEVYHCLCVYLKERNLTTAVGDEGGFAPELTDDRAALEAILAAIERAGYRPGADFVLALDAAASEWKEAEKGVYRQPKSGKKWRREALIEYWERLCGEYPIASLEDGMDEEDWKGWQRLTCQLGHKVQLVGDDLFVTNPERLRRGIREGFANAILLKPNQIGTLSETMEAVELAHSHGYRTILSHRSGETEDVSIADIAVAAGVGQIKSGAPCRSERTAKYNRLLRIEERIGQSALWRPAVGNKETRRDACRKD